MPEGRTLFERTLRGIRGKHAPVWIMRQAGRYLPEYRALREKVDFLTATKTPELAAEITLQPMKRFDLDAAILFSDIMTPLEPMGLAMHFAPGPVIEDPVRTSEQADALQLLDPEEGTPFVLDAIRAVRSELPEDRALIAFAGAPFTLFCYMVQGGGSKDFMEARSFLRYETKVADRLLSLLGTSMARYLTAQTEAGADALMLFDSWVGLLDEGSYRRHVLPVVNEIVARVQADSGKPVIYFANGGSNLLRAASEVHADAWGVDWTLPLSQAAERLGPGAVVQGNLDPSMLFASREELGIGIDLVLSEGLAAKSHIFNLGHGIHRTTDPSQVAFLIDRVHTSSERLYAAELSDADQ